MQPLETDKDIEIVPDVVPAAIGGVSSPLVEIGPVLTTLCR